MLMAEPSFTDVGALNVAIGATLVTEYVKLVELLVWPSFAVMVTVVGPAGPSVVPMVHDHVPAALLPDFVTVPTDADKATVSAESASLQVPVLVAFEPSAVLTEAWSAATDGAWLVGAVTVNALLASTLLELHGTALFEHTTTLQLPAVDGVIESLNDELTAPLC